MEDANVRQGPSPLSRLLPAGAEHFIRVRERQVTHVDGCENSDDSLKATSDFQGELWS